MNNYRKKLLGKVVALCKENYEQSLLASLASDDRLETDELVSARPSEAMFKQFAKQRMKEMVLDYMRSFDESKEQAFEWIATHWDEAARRNG